MADGFDPAWALGADDPLREWANRNLDWSTGRLLQQDPAKAIDSMIKRGIPPPDVHADGSSALPYTASEAAMGGADDPSGAAAAPFVRTNPNGTIAGNITAPASPDRLKVTSVSPFPPGGASTTPQMDPLTAPKTSSLPNTAATDKDALRKLDAEQDDAQDAEDSKTSSGDALSGFAKSLSGIKAPTPPPLNAVGTPSVRSPGSVSPPNLANLMSLLSSGAVPQSVAPALGKLLVQGKA